VTLFFPFRAGRPSLGFANLAAGMGTLMMDEPFSALDVRTGENQSRRNQRTCLQNIRQEFPSA
jgi:ABC-type nitrate/sulfonate/bicarbonate transport system ATPase subunit